MRHDTAIPIGSGGMGEVFKAWDADLERFVALKYLRFNDPELVERLLREARAQARVHHPGVCEVYEVGTEDGRPYIAMQYVEGRQLDEAAAQLSLEQKVLLLVEVAEAVHAAHTVGLIHRDLKPGNILVSEDEDGRLRPFVLDFGIAREHEVPGLTLTGQVLGTPGYLSPEQARGELNRIDRRSDVFALGVILYELVGGVRPFAGDSQATMLVNLLGHEARPLHQVASGVPRDLETVIMTCLEKDPERRYDSARALAEDLRRFLTGEPVVARPVGAAGRLLRRARRHPRIAAVAAAAVLVIVALLAGLVATRWSHERQLRRAQRFAREVERVEAVTNHAYLLPLHDIRPALAQAHERLQLIDAELPALGRESRALAHAALGRGHLSLGEAGPARAQLEQAWELGERSAQTASALGLSLAELYRLALEEAAFTRSAAQRAELVETARAELRDPALALLAQAAPEGERGSYLAAWLAFAGGDFEAALAQLDELHRDDPFFYQGDLLRGMIQSRRYQEAADSGAEDAAELAFGEAAGAFAAAAVVARSDPRPRTELCALWVQKMRIFHWSRGGAMANARDEALAQCGRALEADPDAVDTHLQLSRVHRFWASEGLQSGRDVSADLAASKEHARKVLELDPDNDDAYIVLGVCHRMAANLLAEKGEDPRAELRAAVAAYEEAIALRPNDHGATTSLATALLYLGADAAARGEDPSAHFAAAAEVSRQATELRPEAVGGWVNLGIAEGQSALWMRDTGGEWEQPFSAGARALRQAIEVNPGFYTAHYNLGEMLVEQAVGELRRGRDPRATLDEARPLLELAAEHFPSFAAPSFLLARSAALRAEHARWRGADPVPYLDEARPFVERGLSIRSDDATGLWMASEVDLVAARWQLQRRRDPSAAARHGLDLIDRALAVNPAMAQAMVRRGQLELVVARWLQERGADSGDVLDRAFQAVLEAQAASAGDASMSVLLARIWQLRARAAQAGGRSPERAIAAGLEAVDACLAKDPRRPEAYRAKNALMLLLASTSRDSEEASRAQAEARSAAAEARRLDPLRPPES